MNALHSTLSPDSHQFYGTPLWNINVDRRDFFAEVSPPCVACLHSDKATMVQLCEQMVGKSVDGSAERSQSDK